MNGGWSDSAVAASHVSDAVYTHVPRLRRWQDLLDQGVSPNVADNRGNKPVHYACDSGSLDIVKLLCDYGADLNLDVRAMRLGNAVCHAPESGLFASLNLMDTCLVFRQDANRAGQTPLHIAAAVGFQDIVVYLLESMASPANVDALGHDAVSASRTTTTTRTWLWLAAFA